MKQDEGKPTNDLWAPQWFVDCQGEMLGVTMDDSCYVVLCQQHGVWRPLTHIPPQAAHFLGSLSFEAGHAPARDNGDRPFHLQEEEHP